MEPLYSGIKFLVLFFHHFCAFLFGGVFKLAVKLIPEILQAHRCDFASGVLILTIQIVNSKSRFITCLSSVIKFFLCLKCFISVPAHRCDFASGVLILTIQTVNSKSRLSTCLSSVISVFSLPKVLYFGSRERIYNLLRSPV